MGILDFSIREAILTDDTSYSSKAKKDILLQIYIQFSLLSGVVVKFANMLCH